MKRGKTQLVLLLLLVGAVIAYHYRLYRRLPFYSAGRTAALVLLGRSPWCALGEAVRGIENTGRHLEIERRIMKAIRLVQKDSAGLGLWETPQGRYWIPERERVLHFILTERERKIYGAGAQAVRAGDIVLDCGAHVGTFSREALATGAKLVVAIEPGPEQIACLRRNLAEGIAAGRAMVYEKGVWDREDFLTLHLSFYNPGGDSVVFDRPHGGHDKGPAQEIKVPLTTLDNVVEELKLERVDFIKMDIEGAEQRALAGAQKTLVKYRPRLAIAAYHQPDDPDKIPELVRRAWPGYRMECGPCRENNGVIRPEILFFR
jgi:FkbM family methyltransferase